MVRTKQSSLSLCGLYVDWIHRDVHWCHCLLMNLSVFVITQIGSSQSIKGEITPAVTRRVTRTEEAEGSLDKDSSHSLHHPCTLFRLAGSAFLKCFGIDRSTEEDTEDSLRQESKKER